METVEEILTNTVDTPPEDDIHEDEWLIKDRFKRDDEGVSKLVDAYKNMQSKADKVENKLKETTNKYQRLDELEKFLKENPETVEVIQQQLTKEDTPPKKPADYDPLDELVEGTSSAKWRQEYEQYLVNLGRGEAKKEIDKFKGQLTEKEKQTEFANSLIKAGLKPNELDDFNQFMNDPNNSKPETLLKIYRLLKHPTNTPPMDRVPSAAAVEGATPIKKNLTPAEQKTQSLKEGIMKFSKG